MVTGVFVGLCLALATTGMALADDDERPIRNNSWFSSERGTEELAVDLVHPVAKIFSIKTDLVSEPMQGNLPGAGDQTTTNWNFTTTYPIVLDSGKSLILRATLPIRLDQPTYVVVPDVDEFIDWEIRQEADVIDRDGYFYTTHDHAYDISYDIAWGGVSDSGFISMYGIAGVFPTSQDGSVERDQYLLGPEVAFGKIWDWGTFGVWASHLTDVADAQDRDIPLDSNLSHLKFWFSYGLGNGWQIISNPRVTYDWEGADDNKLFIPLGGGVSKTFRWGRMPWKLDLEAYNYIEAPEAFAPEWMFSISLTPVMQDLAWK